MANTTPQNVHGKTANVRVDEALKAHIETELALARTHEPVADDGNSFSRGVIFSKSRPAMDASLAVDPAIAASNKQLTEATLNAFSQKLASVTKTP